MFRSCSRSFSAFAKLSAVAWLSASGSCVRAQIAPGQPPPVTANSVSNETKPLNYEPITGMGRVAWFAKSTLGPQSLTAGLFSAGFGTALNRPVEYGPHWDGFADRYGIRLTGIATGNAMEAGLGAIWGEDPRYFRAEGQPFGGRIKNVLKLSVAHYRRDGHLAPAYAFFIADPGNNFLSNTWRERSEANTNDALLRTLWGFLGRVGSNAFEEFWPDVRQHALRH